MNGPEGRWGQYVLVATMLCDPNAADAPTTLVDVIFDNVNAKK